MEAETGRARQPHVSPVALVLSLASGRDKSSKRDQRLDKPAKTLDD